MTSPHFSRSGAWGSFNNVTSHPIHFLQPNPGSLLTPPQRASAIFTLTRLQRRVHAPRTNRNVFLPKDLITDLLSWFPNGLKTEVHELLSQLGATLLLFLQDEPTTTLGVTRLLSLTTLGQSLLEAHQDQ